jgi:hypothetical protein
MRRSLAPANARSSNFAGSKVIRAGMRGATPSSVNSARAPNRTVPLISAPLMSSPLPRSILRVQRAPSAHHQPSGAGVVRSSGA